MTQFVRFESDHLQEHLKYIVVVISNIYYTKKLLKKLSRTYHPESRAQLLNILFLEGETLLGKRCAATSKLTSLF
jgi:hypothetical protein